MLDRVTTQAMLQESEGSFTMHADVAGEFRVTSTAQRALANVVEEPTVDADQSIGDYPGLDILVLCPHLVGNECGERLCVTGEDLLFPLE